MKITFLGSGNIRSNFSYRILQLASSLQKRGHSVTIIVPSADKYNKFISEKITTLNGVTIRQPFQFKTKHMIVNLVPYLLSAAYMIWKDRSDSIYIYKPTPISAIGLLGKLFHGTPVVLDMDDLGSEVMKIEGHPWYQRVLVAWSEKIAARYADKIIVASSFLFDFYRKQFPNKPIHIVPNGIDKGWLTPLQSPRDKRRIVFMGALNRKNILEPLFDVAPEIIRHHPDVEILIMGDGTYFSYFKEKARALNIATHTIFSGWVDIAQLKNNLFPGDIGYNYMPPERTVLAASNMKVSQYMARGVVPLISTIGDLPALIDSGRAGYSATPNDLSSLKMTILTALADKGLFEKSAHARRYVERQYSWDTLAEGVERFLGNTHTKKIYAITTNIPGNTGGPEIRNFHIIKALANSADTSVDIFCIGDKTSEQSATNLKNILPAKVHFYIEKSLSWLGIAIAILFNRVQPKMEQYKRSGIGKAFREACQLQLPDIVHIEQINAYYCIAPHIPWLKEKGVTIVLDAHNVEARLFEESLQLFSFPKKIVGKWLAPKLRNMEMRATQQSDVIIACSDKDAEYFKQYNSSVYVIPNGVDCGAFTPTEKKNLDSVLFIGGVTYPPNEDGILYYLREIHPAVKKENPKLTITIIGATTQWLDRHGINDASVQAVGFVEDIRPYLAQAAVGICPIRYGSGTRLKILTYLAAGLPVIATTKGAEGIHHAGEIVIADDAGAFKRAILDILSNNMQYVEIAKKGRALAVQQYDWTVIVKALLSIYP